MSRLDGAPQARWRRHGRALSRLLRTRYPPFVFGLPRRSRQAPVFVYHEVDAAGFEADLRFLAENGYRTLGAGEFVACAGRAESSVLLTFDDARRNFWEVVFPLLRRFGARATVFAPTYWIEPGAGEEAEERPGAAGKFMSWDQLRECARSGLVDVEAHGHRHALVYASARPVGFASPDLVARHDLYDWPMRHENGRDRLGVPPLGTPVYAAEPLLSAAHRVLEDDRATEACRRLVAEAGGAEFFRRPDAAALLRRTVAAAARGGGAARRAEPAALAALVRDEFERSRELLERHLGRAPRLFAYPWMLGSDLSLRCAAETGFEAVFGVGFDFGRARRIGWPLAFGRLKGEWLRLLPGRGRRRLREVLPERVRGSLRSVHLAH